MDKKLYFIILRIRTSEFFIHEIISILILKNTSQISHKNPSLDIFL